MHCTEGVFLDIIRTKILRLVLHAIHSHLHQLIYTPPPPHGFLELDVSTAIAESRWGLGFVYIISLLILEVSIVISLFYIKTSFSSRNNNYKFINRRINQI
jgi:hypothetical protein